MTQEAVLEPDLPIVDPHHHLWDRSQVIGQMPPSDHPFMQIIRNIPTYLLNDLLRDLGSGHNIVGTVYMECGSMYRADGPQALKPVGETEFVNGIAAMTASGTYGKVRACAGIVGHVDLLLGGRAAEEALRAHIAAGGGRFRGIRHLSAYDDDMNVLGPLAGRSPKGLLLDTKFRDGFKALEKLGLSFDAWLIEPQLDDLIDLAQHFPQTVIVLDHVGTPLNVGRYAGKLGERFGIWRDAIRTLATCDNVYVKCGGLPMPFLGWKKNMSDPNPDVETMARQWRPYIETCIEVFGVGRCMFESNFPVDRFGCDYRSLWNVFKVIAKNYAVAEKAALFSGTAKKVYRLDLPG